MTHFTETQKGAKVQYTDTNEGLLDKTVYRASGNINIIPTSGPQLVGAICDQEVPKLVRYERTHFQDGFINWVNSSDRVRLE